MEALDLESIKKKSARGIVALTSRTFVLQLIAFGATFLLTIFLEPSIFGVFYVVSAIIAFLGYFSDIGLAAALIQKKDALTRDDLQTTFTLQQMLVGGVVVVSLIFSGTISTFYGLDADGLALLRVLILAFFLSSLKTIPSVILERTLDFNKLVISQIAETLSFYVVTVALAWQGFGIASFTWGVLVRGLVGLITIYMLSPWRVGLSISRPVAKSLLKFGLPFQLNSFLALIKDDLLTVFLGKALPFAEVGYIGWAKKWAEVPLRLIMDSVIRVTFPTFSRLQESEEHLRRAIEKTLFGLALSIFPISIGLLFFVRPLIDIVPRYDKWIPALLSFYLFTVASAIASLTTPLTNAINAMGKIKITLGFMVMWTFLTWILTVVFISWFGFVGVSLALLVISSTIILVVYKVKSVVPFSFWDNVYAPLMGALAQACVYMFLLPVVGTNKLGLVGVGLAGVILYIGIVFMLKKDQINGLIVHFRGAK